METSHESVLLQEAVVHLNIKPTDTVVDATIGGAGHFSAMLEHLDARGTLVGFDADGDAIERGKAALADISTRTRVEFAHDNFRNIIPVLDGLNIPTIDKALFDLGWSSFHLSSGRGFSFKASEPLLMTYGEPEQGKTAADLVNSAPEETLADIFFTYGEERFARPIARSIVRARKQATILTTDDLVAAVLAGTPVWYHHRKLHPATKVFQALRIAVNDELGALREGLGGAMERLSIGGRIAVITFHSIEDRIVKTMFRDAAHAGHGVLITRKPIIPSSREATHNPRARSAKLRIFEAARTVTPAAKVSIRSNNIYSYL
ncbi:MAG: Ribosomal small subunit methyltransferase [Parcubacteria group bacterium]|nr:Ribosomal small subunit methyltransferase [Parcubacteria group bacterium]